MVLSLLTSEFCNSIIVLFAKGTKLGFVVEVIFLKVTAKFGQFRLAFLVNFDLGGGGAPGFILKQN